jgi:hypothetical protein
VNDKTKVRQMELAIENYNAMIRALKKRATTNSVASLAIGGGDLFGEGVNPIAAKLWHAITGTQVAIALRGTVTP